MYDAGKTPLSFSIGVKVLGSYLIALVNTSLPRPLVGRSGRGLTTLCWQRTIREVDLDAASWCFERGMSEGAVD